MLPAVYFLQCTRQKSHSIKVTGLDTFKKAVPRDLLPQLQWHFVFVSPHEVPLMVGPQTLEKEKKRKSASKRNVSDEDKSAASNGAEAGSAASDPVEEVEVPAEWVNMPQYTLFMEYQIDGGNSQTK